MRQVFIFFTFLLFIHSSFARETNVNHEAIPDSSSYAASPGTPDTTYTLNITLVFGQLASKQPYSFYGNLKIPIQKFFGPTTDLNVSQVLFKDGTTFKRVVHAKQSLLEGINPQLFVSFKPSSVNPSTREIFISKILLEEEIQTISVNGSETTVLTSTIHRYFGDGSGYGLLDGTVTYPNAKKFGQYYEDSGSSTHSFGSDTRTTRTGGGGGGSASTVHASVVLVGLSLAALYLN